MAGGTELYPLLAAYESHQVADEPFHYVFVFPNFYTDNEELLSKLNTKKSIDYCHEIFSDVFKLLEDNVDPDGKERDAVKRSKWIKRTWESFVKDTYHKEVEWIKFLRMIVGVFVKILQEELKLETRVFFSGDNDEIFLKVRASEGNLRIQADMMDYKVQVNIKRPNLGDNLNELPRGVFPKKGYSSVCPFGEYQRDNSINIFQTYKTYKKDSKKAKTESESYSIFKYTDKVRIVLGMINSAVDLGVLLEKEIITHNYSLHQEKEINYLKENWANFRQFWKNQDLCAIRGYFGEKIGYYFAWLEYYILSLIFPGLLGLAVFVIQRFFDGQSTFDSSLTLTELMILVFSLCLSLGSTLLDQLWARRQNELSWKWGTTDLIEVEQQRPSFKGTYKTDPVTGQKRKVQDQRLGERIKRSLGYSVTLMFVFTVLALIVAIFIAKRQYVQYVNELSFLNACQIKIMNSIYRTVAKKLTEWENYEFDSEYNDALTLKLYVFQFINSYSALFYIAFFKNPYCTQKDPEIADLCQKRAECIDEYGSSAHCSHFTSDSCDCMYELSNQLFWILVTNVFMNLVELGTPYLKIKWANYKERKEIEKQNNEDHQQRRLDITPIEEEAKLAVYETPLDDYMELIINYGYVVMFSVAFPLFPFFSLLLNILEVRVDAFKLAHLSQRPFPAPANSIGEWMSIIQTISIIGALTNIGILIFTDNVFDLQNPQDQWLAFVIVEHGLILFKISLSAVIPDVPLVVKQGLIWSKRIATERIYGKPTDLEEQKILRNLYFEEDKNIQEFVLDSKNIRSGDY